MQVARDTSNRDVFCFKSGITCWTMHSSWMHQSRGELLQKSRLMDMRKMSSTCLQFTV